MVNSEREEHIGISAPFENVSERNKTLHVPNTSGETRNNIPDEVSEFAVPGRHFDRQPNTHHNIIKVHQDFLLLMRAGSLNCSDLKQTYLRRM